MQSRNWAAYWESKEQKLEQIAVELLVSKARASKQRENAGRQRQENNDWPRHHQQIEEQKKDKANIQQALIDAPATTTQSLQEKLQANS